MLNNPLSAMAEICLFLFLLAVFSVEAQRQESNVSLGSSLSPTSSSYWLSPSGLFAFGFYRQGNGYKVGVFIVGMPEQTVVWTANRDAPPVAGDYTLLLSGDGNLLLRSAQGQNTPLVNLAQSATAASMLDSGNFVIYHDSKITWQSFANPTDTLLAGQFLAAGAELFSSVSDTNKSTGMFQLVMQTDGNLVQYPMERTVESSYYSTRTVGRGDNVTLHLEDDASLFLLNGTGVKILNITTGGYLRTNMIYLLRLDQDGIFRIYSYDLTRNGKQAVIFSSSDDECVAKGLCGLNMFCVAVQSVGSCVCLPGFAPIQPGNMSSGCERNFTAQICGTTTGSSDYSFQFVSNTVWEDSSYFSLPALAAEDCKRACLEDCNCEAAMFKDTVCTKQRLPLKFGRRDMTNFNQLFVKVGNPVSTIVNPTQGSKKQVRNGILIVCIVLAALGSLMIITSGLVMYKSRHSAYKRISRRDEAGLGENTFPQSFTYFELDMITNGFRHEIGAGAFGTVYKGIALDGVKEVAVKRLNKVSEQAEREFQTEVAIIGRTHHRNLVRLLGYCLEGPHRLLVYKYMSRGSLADVLFTAETKLSWEQRMEIAKSIARGILYLHEECETQIIHCDIKPQNILIDEDLCPKISDFGLAKLLKPDQSKTCTGIRGTRGYVAPEWFRNLPVTLKADVFSFGIVLLELVAQRRNVDCNLGEGEVLLEELAFDCWEEGQLEKLVGEEKVERRMLETVVKTAFWSIQDEPSTRPTVRKVLLMLEGTADIPDPPRPTFL